MNKKKSKNKPKVIKTIKPISNNNLFTEVQKNSIISTVIEYARVHPEMLTPSMKKVDKKLIDIKIKKNISITVEIIEFFCTSVNKLLLEIGLIVLITFGLFFDFFLFIH